MPPRAVCPLAFPCPVLRSPAFPTSQPSREILPIAGQQNKRAVAVTNQQWLARACPPEFGSNHGLVWLMIGYSRDQPTSVPVRARSVDTLIADIAKRPRQVREVPTAEVSGQACHADCSLHSVQNNLTSALALKPSDPLSDFNVLSRSAYHRRSHHQSACRVRAGLCPVHDLSPASYRRDPQTAQNSSQGRSRPLVAHE